MSILVDQLLEDFRLSVMIEEDLDRCNREELKEFYNRLSEVSCENQAYQSMYNLSPYDEDTVHIRW